MSDNYVHFVLHTPKGAKEILDVWEEKVKPLLKERLAAHDFGYSLATSQAEWWDAMVEDILRANEQFDEEWEEMEEVED